MITKKISSQKQVSVTTYLVISIVSLIAAVGIGYYYFNYMK